MQPFQTPSEDAHPLIQLNIQNNLSNLYLRPDLTFFWITQVTWVSRGKDSSSSLAVCLTRSRMALCCSSASVAFRQKSSPCVGFSSDKRFAKEHKRAIKGRCSAIDSLRPLAKERSIFIYNADCRTFYD